MALLDTLRSIRPWGWLRSRAGRTRAWERLVRRGGEEAAAGRLQPADRALGRALRLAEHFEPDDPRLLATVERLAALHGLAARWDDSERLHLRALALRVSRPSPRSAGLAAIHRELAEIYRAQGRSEDAARSAAEAKRLLASALGPEMAELSESLRKAGLQEGETGDEGL